MFSTRQTSLAMASVVLNYRILFVCFALLLAIARPIHGENPKDFLISAGTYVPIVKLTAPFSLSYQFGIVWLHLSPPVEGLDSYFVDQANMDKINAKQEFTYISQGTALGVKVAFNISTFEMLDTGAQYYIVFHNRERSQDALVRLNLDANRSLGTIASSISGLGWTLIVLAVLLVLGCIAGVIVGIVFLIRRVRMRRRQQVSEAVVGLMGENDLEAL